MTKVYYKVYQILQSESGTTKCDRMLLQRVSGITVWQIVKYKVKCDSYYKVRHNNGKCTQSILFTTRSAVTFALMAVE